jgi:hypothetical protein
MKKHIVPLDESTEAKYGLTRGSTRGVYHKDVTTIYKNEDGSWSVSWSQMWLPGAYADIDAALYAHNIIDLDTLWRKVNPILPSPNMKFITLNDLKDFEKSETE